MRQLDFREVEGLVLLAAHTRRGTWGQSTLLRGCKTFRCGGQLQTVASQHTLLVVALTVALRDIPARDITRLLAERRRLKKPRLIVRCTDKNFIAAMQHLATGQETGDVPTLRAGRNFLGMLLYQISRFTIEYEYAEPQEATDDGCCPLGQPTCPRSQTDRGHPPDTQADFCIRRPLVSTHLGQSRQDVTTALQTQHDMVHASTGAVVGILPVLSFHKFFAAAILGRCLWSRHGQLGCIP